MMVASSAANFFTNWASSSVIPVVLESAGLEGAEVVVVVVVVVVVAELAVVVRGVPEAAEEVEVEGGGGVEGAELVFPSSLVPPGGV
jgi:hypothetical protein